MNEYNFPEFRLKAGQIADFDVVAPFDFAIRKPDAQLEQERERVKAQIPKPYSPNYELAFESLRLIDSVMVIISQTEWNDGIDITLSLLKDIGFEFSREAIIPLRSVDLRERARIAFKLESEMIYERGIYDSSSADSISIYDSITLQRRNIRDLFSTSQAIQKFSASFARASYSRFASELAPNLFKPNLFVNQEKLRELQETALSALSTSEGMFYRNEVIVSKNEKITEEKVNILRSLETEYINRKMTRSGFEQVLLSLGLMLFNFIIIMTLNYYLNIQKISEEARHAIRLPMNLGVLILIIFSIINSNGLNYSYSILPFQYFGITAAILVGLEFGIFYSVGSALLVSPFINWDPYTIVLYLLSTIMALILIRRNNSFSEYLSIWFCMIVSALAVAFTISIYKSDPFITIARNLGFVALSSTFSAVFALLSIPQLQKHWNQVTKQGLLELLDFNHPLLKKLATDAVGTYHHSLVVGNLSERAAEAIGANPLLARVGSYYHDIGKTINTSIFTENNEKSSDIHNTMAPEESAALIKNHVKEGLDLARKYKLPNAVTDIILQHHGTSYIRYFLDQAEKNRGVEDESLFRYPGPRPLSKEAVLVMIADVVESTIKAKNLSSDKEITAVVESSIQRIIREGQLDEAPITMKELTQVKQAMLPMLQSINRKRMEYPEDNNP